MDEPAAHHRRIELQSPADLTYLEGNIKRAARQKIDLHLPPTAAPEGEDALRRRVEQEVDDYLRNTFTSTRQNISINGMSIPTEESVDVEEFEPFDERLRGRLADLEAQKQSLTERLARLRRSAPQQAARNFEAAYNAHDSALRDEALRNKERALESVLNGPKSKTKKKNNNNTTKKNEGEGEEEEEEGAAANDGNGDGDDTHANSLLQIEGLKRTKEMSKTWSAALEKLQDVSEGFPGTVGRLERSMQVVSYIKPKEKEKEKEEGK